MSGKSSKLFSDHRTYRFLIFMVALVTIICLIPLSGLKIDFNPLQLLNNRDPEKISYDQFKSQFNTASEEQTIFIALRNNQGIFQKDFLEKVDSLTRFLLNDKQILRVYSLTNTGLIYFNGKDVNARPLLHINQPEFYQQDSDYLLKSKEFRDLLISKDSDYIGIGAFNDTSLTEKQKKHLIESIQSKINELNFDEAHVVSRIQFEDASFRKWKLIAAICFCSLFSVIIIGFLLLKFSAKKIWTSLVIIWTGIIWLLAFISLFRYPLNFFSAGIVLLLVILLSCLLVYLRHPSYVPISTRIKVISSVLVILLTAVTIFFISRKQIDVHLRDAIPKRSEAFSNLDFMEKNFYGSRPFELALTVRNDQQSFYDIDIMKKEQDIENFLRDSLRAGALISPMSLFKGANKAFHNGSINYFRIPDSSQLVQRFAEAIMQTEYADELQRYMGLDGKTIRISGRMPDVGAKQFYGLAKKFEGFLSRNYPQLFTCNLTGSSVIYDRLTPRIEKLLATAIVLTIGIYLLAIFNIGQIGFNKNHLKN